MEWRGGAREGAKIGWLMFYDTWFQLIYMVSCIIWGVGRCGEDGEAGGGGGCEPGRGQRLVG